MVHGKILVSMLVHSQSHGCMQGTIVSLLGMRRCLYSSSIILSVTLCSCGSWRKQPDGMGLIRPRVNERALCMFEMHYKSLVIQLAEALVYLHSKGFSHNDLHEGNVLLHFKKGDGGDWDARVGICDWGRAAQVGSDTRLGVEGKGGRKFLPPEHILPPDWRTSGRRGGLCAPTTDVFSFGYLLNLVVCKRKDPPPKQWLQIARSCQEPGRSNRPPMTIVLAQLKAST